MGILTWIRNKILNGTITITATDGSEFFSLSSESYLRELAFETAVSMISNAVSKCEFKTFFRGKEIKEQEYYLWNIEPNRNQNSSAFIHKWIHTLYRENECLIIEQNGQLLVADSFQKQTYALYDYQFTGVTVDNFTFDKTFYMSDVLYFQLRNNDVRSLINGLAESYAKLISYAMKSYQKSKGSKGILDISTTASGRSDFKEKFENLMNERFKNFFAADNAVLPLFEGYKYTDVSTSKTYSGETTRDIKAMANDIFEFTARAFGIPPVLLLGDMADTSKAIDAFLTFCIDPLCDMLQEEINRKRNGLAGHLAKTFLKIDTRCIKHVDLLTVATAIDKLISSGAFCINDIRELVGDQPIDEPWAKQHFMTKNYSTVEDLLRALNEALKNPDSS